MDEAEGRDGSIDEWDDEAERGAAEPVARGTRGDEGNE